MRIDVERIIVEKDVVTIRVDSLNQAFTVASRRLQPERRSHGGRIYDHIVHVRGHVRTRLEEIRRKVESGSWKIPEEAAESPASDSSNHPANASPTRRSFD